MLKKINAVISLLLTAMILIHIGVCCYSYAAMWYDPIIIKTIARVTAGLVAVHALLSIAAFFFLHDGAALTKYPRQNLRLILLRATALLMLLLLHPHFTAFKFMESPDPFTVQRKLLVILPEFLFFGTTLLHVGLAFTRGLITLGLLKNDRQERTADRIMWIICGLFFAASVGIILRAVWLWH